MTITAQDTIVGQIEMDEQRQLVADIREVIRQAPLFAVAAGRFPMSVRVTNAGKVGWVADERGGYRYQARHPVTGKPWPKIPKAWKLLADRYESGELWDCAHIVWYAQDAREGKGAVLGEHRDKTEHDKSGVIVTVALGDPADWWVREDEEAKPTMARLNSGAIVVFKGPSRHVLHRIGKVHYGDADMFHPSPLDGPGRIALSIRSGAGAP